MEIIRSLTALQAWRAQHDAQKIGFVPTMGALHDGHLALVKEAKKQCDQVIVSIFVNPTQFAAHEDLDTYPKTVQQDSELLTAHSADALWLPSVADIYPNGLEVDVEMGGITKYLEGEFRPHFFNGVATVVKRLFEHVKPDAAFFGEKDFQQLQVIRQLVQKYTMVIDIIGVPTVRDKDGLALSSRNAYLSEEQKKIAITLNKVMKNFAESAISEEQAAAQLRQHGFDKIDYITKRNKDTFERANPDRVLVAAWIGTTRLIDNMGFLQSK